MVTVCCQVAFQRPPEPAGNGTPGRGLGSPGGSVGPERMTFVPSAPLRRAEKVVPLLAHQLEKQPPRAEMPLPLSFWGFWPLHTGLHPSAAHWPQSPPTCLFFHPHTERMTPTFPCCGLTGDDEIMSASALSSLEEGRVDTSCSCFC